MRAADRRLRERERRWQQSGDVHDEAAYLLERERRGELTRDQLRLLSYLDDPAATVALGEDARVGCVFPEVDLAEASWRDSQGLKALLKWVGGLKAWGKAAAARASVAAARAISAAEDEPLPEWTAPALAAVDAWSADPSRERLAELRGLVPEEPRYERWAEAAVQATAWCHAKSPASKAVSGAKAAVREAVYALQLSDEPEGEALRVVHAAICAHLRPWVREGGGVPKTRQRTRQSSAVLEPVAPRPVTTDVFRSELPLKVSAGERELGQTPPSVDLGGVRDWSARPVGGVRLLSRVEGLAGVPGLDLGGFKVRDRHLSQVGRLAQLETLSLRGADAISDDGLEALARLERLRELDLRRCRGLTGRGLGALRRLERLRVLRLGEVPLNHAGYRELATLTQLEELELAGCPGLDDGALRALAPLTSLRRLSLDDATALTDLAPLRGWVALEALELRGCSQLTDAGLAGLAGLESLERLSLDRCQVRGAGLAHLVSLNRLRRLSLSDCPLLRAEALPPLARISPRLTELDLRANWGIRNGRLAEAAFTALSRPGLALELNETSTAVSWPDLDLEGVGEGVTYYVDVGDRIERAKSGRARCQACREAIAKDCLRFVEVDVGFEGPSNRYLHSRCAADFFGERFRKAVASYAGSIPEREALLRLAAGSGGPPRTPRAELAKSGRARCMACDEGIAKASLRVVSEREVEGVGLKPGYLHPSCALEFLGCDGATVLANSDLSQALREQLEAELTGAR